VGSRNQLPSEHDGRSAVKELVQTRVKELRKIVQIVLRLRGEYSQPSLLGMERFTHGAECMWSPCREGAQPLRCKVGIVRYLGAGGERDS